MGPAMKRELYAILKNDKFMEAAFCIEDTKSDDVNRYIHLCERKYGLKGFSYVWGMNAQAVIPKGYKPRRFVTNLHKERNKKEAYFITKFTAIKD